jgi:hypothetical protein
MARSKWKRKTAGGVLLAIALGCYVTAFILLFFPVSMDSKAEAGSGLTPRVGVRTDFDEHFWTFFALIGGGLVSGAAGIAVWKSE